MYTHLIQIILHLPNSLLSKIPCLNTHLLIFGGDLYCVIDPSLDHSALNVSPPSRIAKQFSDVMSLMGCAVPWRFQHPHSRKYSFFSDVHHSFSCIDYFFIDCSLLPKVTSSEYLPIVISDHGPLVLNITLSTQPRSPPYWRFDSLLLSNSRFCDRIAAAVDDFLICNQMNSTSHSLLQEALKVYLRGQIISYESYLNKFHKDKLDELSKSLLDLDHQYALNPSPVL